MSDIQSQKVKTIAIIGGTGKEGKGLAYRWARAGYTVLIGSRSIDKAKAAVEEIKSLIGPEVQIEGLENSIAASQCDVAVLTVPYSAHKDMLEAIEPFIRGKILIDVSVPLVPPHITRVQMPAAGSAGMEAQIILGDQVYVATAFQNISYEHLLTEEEIQCDVLVCGVKKNVRDVVINLVRAAGLMAWDGGPLENSMVVEGMTSILIGLNKQFGVSSAGIRITGIPRK